MKPTTRNSRLTLLLLLWFSGITLGQKKDVDKLRNQISKETNDTSRVKLLIKLAFSEAGKDSVAAQCFREVYKLSKKKQF